MQPLKRKKQIYICTDMEWSRRYILSEKRKVQNSVSSVLFFIIEKYTFLEEKW